MAVELTKLIEMASGKDLCLEAGECGMNRLISWIHMVESLDATTFLDGDEIVFSTGIAITNDDDFLKLVKAMDEHKAAAIIINIGPYVSRIPKSVISYCNEHNLPLFSVPWRIHLAELIRIFTSAITKSDQEQQEISNAFKNAIFFPKQEDLYIVPLTHKDFSSQWAYSCIAIRIFSETSSVNRAESLAISASSHMKHSFGHFNIFSYHDMVIAVVANYDIETLHKFATEMVSFIKYLLTSNENIFYGVGKITKSIRCIYKSYNQAMSIMHMHEKGILKEESFFYDELGIYKLLMNIDDQEILSEYYEKELGTLEAYDKNNGTDLYDTLKDFLLKYNGSIKETSDALFVHRNTVNYKLNKVSEILNVDLSELDVRTKLSVAFMVKEIMQHT